MNYRILVVDDNKETLVLYKRSIEINVRSIGLQLKGGAASAIEVETADSVTSALQKLRALDFDILVVDLKIPGSTGNEMGGLEVINEAKIFCPNLPIIVITGFGSIDLAKKTLLQGVFDFIEKSASAALDLSNSIKRAIEAQHDMIIKAGNPFNPKSGLEPKVFGGRIKELNFFENILVKALNNDHRDHFIVLGDWGIGKSTLLKEFRKICKNYGYFASIIPLEPLQTGTKPIDAARSMVEGVLRGIPYSVRSLERLAKFFDSIGISVFGTGFHVSRDTEKIEHSAMTFLYDSLLNLWDDIKDKTDVLVILFDDLENFLEVPQILMTLKLTLSLDAIAKTGIIVGLATTRKSWLEFTSTEKHHPVARYFLSRIELEPLNKTEVDHTIHDTLAETGVFFSKPIMENIYEYTKGHPFEMQLLAHHLFENHLSRRVGSKVWEKSLQNTLKDMGGVIFDQWYSKASTSEKKVLNCMAVFEKPISLKELKVSVEDRRIKISQSNLSKCVQRLIGKNLVLRISRGLYVISDKMFRAYLLNQHEEFF